MDEFAVAQPFGLFDQLAHAVPYPKQRSRFLLAGQRLSAATPPDVGFNDDFAQFIPPFLAPQWARGVVLPQADRRPAALPRETARRFGDPTRRPAKESSGFAALCQFEVSSRPCPAAGRRRRAALRGAAPPIPVPRPREEACWDRPPEPWPRSACRPSLLPRRPGGANPAFPST